MTAELKLVPPIESTEVETARVCRACELKLPIASFHQYAPGKHTRSCRACVRSKKTSANTQLDHAERVQRDAEEASTGMRACSTCAVSKPLAAFHGYRSDFTCKACKKKREQERSRKLHELPEPPPGYDTRTRMAKMAKARAKEKNVPFEIERGDIFVPEFCPVLGIRLAHSWGHGPKDETPSLDRIKPSKGYVRGNIAVISNRANRMKSDGTAEEHERIAAWMRSQGLK